MPIDISIIIPMYNMESYIQECLDSAVGQSVTNIEMLCIDDASTDNTLKYVETAAKADRRIKIVTHNTNRGLAATRNTGLRNASGDYIFFLDADDFFPTKNALKCLLDCAKTYGSEEVIGRIRQWFPDNDLLQDGYHSTYQRKDLFSVNIATHGEFSDNCIACNKLIKKSLITSNSVFFDEDLLKFEDNPFSCKIHALTNSISYIHEHTYTHRKRSTGDVSLSYTYSAHDAFMWNKACLYMTHFILNYSNEIAKTFIRKSPLMLEASFSTLKIVDADSHTYKKLKNEWDYYITLIRPIDLHTAQACQTILDSIIE